MVLDLGTCFRANDKWVLWWTECRRQALGDSYSRTTFNPRSGHRDFPECQEAYAIGFSLVTVFLALA